MTDTAAREALKEVEAELAELEPRVTDLRAARSALRKLVGEAEPSYVVTGMTGPTGPIGLGELRGLSSWPDVSTAFGSIDSITTLVTGAPSSRSVQGLPSETKGLKGAIVTALDDAGRPIDSKAVIARVNALDRGYTDDSIYESLRQLALDPESMVRRVARNSYAHVRHAHPARLATGGRD